MITSIRKELLGLIPRGEAFAGLVPPPTLMDAVTQYIMNTSQFGFLLALLLSMGAVSQEKEHISASMVLVKPLPRSAFLLAKFVALGFAFLAAMLLAELGAFYYTTILFARPDLTAGSTHPAPVDRDPGLYKPYLDVQHPVPFASLLSPNSQPAWWALSVSLVIIAACLMIACLALQKQELKEETASPRRR